MMARPFFIIAIVLLCALSSSNGLKCFEGFNMTFNGIPLYYWAEKECVGDSKCIGQEIAIDTMITGAALRTAVRYGACASSSYADYLDCDNLFGAGSTFDPADLLDMIPGIEAGITDAVEEFSKNASVSLIQLLSDGTGTASFVDGIFTFSENLGFNMEKALPLKPSLVKLLTALFGGQQQDVTNAVTEFFNEFAQLDTANSEFTAAITTLLTNVNVSASIINDDPIVKTVIERGPGLLRSVFPSDWQVELWYDVAIKLAGDINPANWTKSTEDMVATIKSSYQIPTEIGAIVNPMLDAMPDLAKRLQMNPASVGNWSLELLKKFSEEDEATKEFSAALIKFVQATTGGAPLQYELLTTIEWIPGLFYKTFPGDKTVIQEVYTKMAAGFNSFNFSDLGSTAAETKLSTMIFNLIKAFGGEDMLNDPQSGPLSKAIVVNFAKMFYDLMDVNSANYSGYIDTFSTVIDGEFKSWPNINVGSMIGNLIKGFGGSTPKELAPMLKNIQGVLTAVMTQPIDGTNIVEALKSVSADYKAEFPESPFPDLVDSFIDIMYSLLTLNPADPEYVNKLNNLNLELQFWNIDMQFAAVKAFNYTDNELYQMAMMAWPEYRLYIQVMRAMDPEDVKQLIKDIIKWVGTPPLTTESFVEATKPTFMKITTSIESLMGDIRKAFKPDSCRFGSCDSDLCNTQQYVSMRQEYTKARTVAPTNGTLADSTSSDEEFTMATTLAPTNGTLADSTSSDEEFTMATTQAPTNGTLAASTSSDEEFTKATTLAPTNGTVAASTTSDARGVTTNVQLNIFTFWMFTKFFF